jgi:ABC-2 type transport system ATP-binding protein
MITALHLEKRFGDFAAVSDISFTAEEGQIVGFLGPNGAGKSTTLRMLSTYSPPTGGTATVAGCDIITQSEEVRRNIGYLPENPPLYNELTVRENLEFVSRIKGIPSSRIKEAVDAVLEKCAITDTQNKLCKFLSKGYRQRVGIAQAIVHSPRVIILDEPTGGLDPKQIIEIRTMIRALKSSHTVLLSTHILPEVSMVCDKVVIVNRGRTVLEQPLSEVHDLEKTFIECISKDAHTTPNQIFISEGAA